ncbi:hypothetical protein Vadar_027213 [Vaccinium darrowii]|uniref:Uncharacterized protein n=1 Tax=Vaccinium darrowii TaxID=229202 RepID=A0ACB7YZ30_9ERIC|nr:hypothetical protein Vadar_027213 [Vaccinium darrowii]
MAYIPMGMIADIFSWLPVKSLLRFRYDNNYSLPFDSLDDAIVELDWPFKYSVDKTKFWGYCDGLVCLGIGEENAAIWNSATRKCRKLPIAPIEFPENCQDEPIISFAIGYDSITDDYKVVRMVEFGFFKYDVEVRVYSMRLNFWRRVQDIPCEFGIWQWPMGGLSAVGCGVLHWIGLAPFGNLIVAFDLLAEEHRLLPGPECDDTWNLGELGGSLCIFVYNKVKLIERSRADKRRLRKSSSEKNNAWKRGRLKKLEARREREEGPHYYDQGTCFHKLYRYHRSLSLTRGHSPLLWLAKPSNDNTNILVLLYGKKGVFLLGPLRNGCCE